MVFTSLRKWIDLPYMVGRKGTLGDVYHIARGGGGGNNKFRLEIGVLYGGETEAIRASHGHSLGIGVDSDVLPVAEDVCYVVHGTSLSAARSIAEHGLNRGGRIHMHFLACNRNGLAEGVNQVRAGSQAIVIAAATMARGVGIQFYRSANGVIPPNGIEGVIPPMFIRAIRLLHSYDLRWANEDRRRKVSEPVTNGNPFDGYGTAVEDDDVTTKLTSEQEEESESEVDVRMVDTNAGSSTARRSEYIVTSAADRRGRKSRPLGLGRNNMRCVHSYRRGKS